MGTRSHTVIKEDNKVMFVLYRQYDGYLTGHGKALVEFIDGFSFVSGFSEDNKKAGAKVANGAGCFAAQLIMHFKQQVSIRTVLNAQGELETSKGNYIGNIYIQPASEAKVRHNYTYDILFKNSSQEPLFNVWEHDEKIATKITFQEFKQLVRKAEIEEGIEETDYDQSNTLYYIKGIKETKHAQSNTLDYIEV